MRAVSIAALLLAACGRGAPADDGKQSERAAGCAASLVAEIDSESFAAAGLGESSADRDAWRAGSAKAFLSAADALCREGKLDAARIARLKRLQVQYGAGADSAAVWQDEARPDAIILQFAFSPGSPAPDRADVRDALVCWNAPEDSICAERLP